MVEGEIGCAGAVEGGEVPHRGKGEDEFVRVVSRAGRDGVVFDHDDRAGREGGDVGEKLVAEDEVEACHFVARLCRRRYYEVRRGDRLYMLVSRSR